MRTNGLVEVYKEVNEIEYGIRDRTLNEGQNQLDAVSATDNVLQCATRNKMIDFKEIMTTSYRRFVLELNIEYCFFYES